MVDATRPDLLMAAGIERARVLVICIDDMAQVTKLASYAIQTYPNLHVGRGGGTEPAPCPTNFGPSAAATSCARPMTARFG